MLDLEPRDLVSWQRLATYRSVDEFRGLRVILAPQLSRCFYPFVHEGRRRPYGALIAREGDPANFGARSEHLDYSNASELLASADGVNTVVYCTKGKPEGLLRLATPIGSQDDCAGLAASVNGVIVRVDASGVIWIVTAQSVTTIDDRNGWTRPSTESIVRKLEQTVPASDHALRALTQLAYSYFGPRKIGTTLLYSLTDDDSCAHQTPGISVTALGLAAWRRDDWPMIDHHLRHGDGAAVFDKKGRFLRKGVLLEATRAALTIHTSGGARHNSACRHTYDRPDLLAFVVSADGPVAVFSGGVKALFTSLERKPSGGEMRMDVRQCYQ